MSFVMTMLGDYDLWVTSLLWKRMPPYQTTFDMTAPMKFPQIPNDSIRIVANTNNNKRTTTLNKNSSMQWKYMNETTERKKIIYPPSNVRYTKLYSTIFGGRTWTYKVGKVIWWLFVIKYSRRCVVVCSCAASLILTQVISPSIVKQTVLILTQVISPSTVKQTVLILTQVISPSTVKQTVLILTQVILPSLNKMSSFQLRLFHPR